jgi:hypothetical protein
MRKAMTEQTFKLTNFRKGDIIENWPVGGSKRATALFSHESNNKGQRIGRYIGSAKPKFSVYYTRVCLVDGDDGKTHYIGYSKDYDVLMVMSCDMKHSDFGIHPKDENFDSYKNQLFLATGVIS